MNDRKLSVSLATPVGTLVLIGGGEFSFGETREIDEALISRMPSGQRTVAFLPTASGSAEYAGHFGGYLRSLDPGISVVNVPIYRGRDARRQKHLEQLSDSGMIYAGGGMASQFLGTIRDSPADAALREAAATGTMIVAIGAAASCFGAMVRDVRSGALLPGLGWLEGTAIETGFEPEADSGLRRLLSLPEVTLGLGIPARTALLIERSGGATILGEGQIAAFRKR